MSKKLVIILNSLKTIKGILGAAILDKFGIIKANALPEWLKSIFFTKKNKIWLFSKLNSIYYNIKTT